MTASSPIARSALCATAWSARRAFAFWFPFCWLLLFNFSASAQVLVRPQVALQLRCPGREAGTEGTEGTCSSVAAFAGAETCQGGGPGLASRACHGETGACAALHESLLSEGCLARAAFGHLHAKVRFWLRSCSLQASGSTKEADL